MISSSLRCIIWRKEIHKLLRPRTLPLVVFYVLFSSHICFYLLNKHENFKTVFRIAADTEEEELERAADRLSEAFRSVPSKIKFIIVSFFDSYKFAVFPFFREEICE